MTRSFDVFVDLRLNRRLCKQSRGWWFETPSHPLWRHCNGRWSYVVSPCIACLLQILISLAKLIAPFLRKKTLSLNAIDYRVNTLCLTDGIWRQRSVSTLAQVIACCLGPKLLLEAMLITNLWGSVVFTWEQYQSECSSQYFVQWVMNFLFLKVMAYLPGGGGGGGQWVLSWCRIHVLENWITL